MENPKPIALWLASYVDGSAWRGKRGNHQRVGLPPLDFIQRRLHPSEKQMLSHFCGRRNVLNIWKCMGIANPPRHSAPVAALLKVSCSRCVHGNDVLQHWDAESFALRQMLGNPADAYSLHVEDMRQCADLQTVRFKVNLKK